MYDVTFCAVVHSRRSERPSEDLSNTLRSTPMRHVILTILLVLCCALRASTTHLELLLHFDKDRPELSPAARGQLDAFLKECRLEGEYAFILNGHTDSEGSDGYNDRLSEARARSVLDHLLECGVAENAVHVTHSGESVPIRTNTEEAGMAENRRVSVVFDQRWYSCTAELRSALLEGSVQQFTIGAGQDTTVSGAAGVELRFKANAFVDADGSRAQGPVTVELTEALGHQAFIGHRLSTRSGDRMLETGGMLKVSARDANGRELRLAADSPMDVAVPSEVIQDGMELFQSTDGADWTTTGQRLTTVERWLEPPQPYVPDNNGRLPVYKESKKGMPMKPSLPALRRAPIPPRQESYRPHRTFFDFLRAGRAEEQARTRYEQAMAAYVKRLDKYALHVTRFESELAEHPARLERYRVRKQAWDELKKAEYSAWLLNVYGPAAEAAGVRTASRQRLVDSLMTVWQAHRDSSYESYVTCSDLNGTGDMSGLRTYVFQSSQLGWINCDRFYDVPAEQKYQVIAQGRAPVETETFLVFTDLRCVLNMQRMNTGTWVSPAVDKNQRATLFAYTVIDGRPHVCDQPVVPGERTELKFKPSSFAAIGELLRSYSALSL